MNSLDSRIRPLAHGPMASAFLASGCRIARLPFLSGRGMASIKRIQTQDPRMSQAVIHGDTVYLSGQVPADFSAPLKEQVSSTLAKVDKLLHDADSSKERLLSAQLWVRDMGDFNEVNQVWNEWIDPMCKPARACVEAQMAHPDIRFEVMVVAAKNDKVHPMNIATGIA